MRPQQRALAITLSAAWVLLFSTHVGAAIAGLEHESTAMATVNVQVYKKWIGASGDEADVEIQLFCGQGKKFEPRFINPDRPDGWQLSEVPADGLFCNVREIVRDTFFMADVSDCLDLLVIPGQEVECTIVNTKVVKRIDMLNRYGLAMMIAVMLGAGLAAVRRFTPM